MERKEEAVDYDERLRDLELTAMLGQLKATEREQARKRLWGLALSGGGIRSATFALGVLQYLARRNMLGAFHYLSTVSGGGYVGSHVQAMLQRRGLEATTEALWAPWSTKRSRWPSAGATSVTVQKLRRFTNFLSPDNASLSADRLSIGSSYLANLLLTMIQLSSLLLLAVLTPAFLLLLIPTPNKWALAIIALGCTVAAFAIRQRLPPVKRDMNGAVLPAAAPIPEPSSIRHLPPMLLAVAMMALAYQFWYSAPCRSTISCALDPTDWTWTTVYTVGFIMWLSIWWQTARADKELFTYRLVRQVLFGLSGAAATYWLAQSFMDISLLRPLNDPEGAGTAARHLLTISVGALCVLVATFVLTLLHVGLAFTSAERLAKERWARLMGVSALWVVVLAIVPASVAALVIWLTIEHEPSLNQVMTASLVGSGGAGLYVSRLIQMASRTGNIEIGRFRKLIKWAVLWFFVIAVIVLVSALAAKILIAPVPPTFVASTNISDQLLGLRDEVDWEQIMVLLIPIFIWCFFAYFVDENEASMNTFYRNRLVRTYLGSANDPRVGDPETDLAPDSDDFAMASLLFPRREGVPCACGVEGQAGDSDEKSERPLYPLLCATANLVGTDERDWQDRKGASFFFSPLFCGHLPLQRPDARAIGDRPDLLDNWNHELKRAHLRGSDLARDTTLGTAMSISGAAVSSSMGRYSSTALNFLLTLLNVRLGWWIENFNVERFGPEFLGKNLLSELLGMTSDRGRYVYVSDGGHFENLGIYELVRRKCRFILSVDASADPDRDFEGLGDTVRKCRVDFGADIDIDVSAIRPDSSGKSKNCAAVGRITYSDRSRGILLYIKASLVGNEPADIGHYAAANASFPHQPTSDQFFDEAQFEAYRHLGYCCGERTLESIMSRMQPQLEALAKDAMDTKQSDSAAKGGRTSVEEARRVRPLYLKDHGFKEQFLDELVEAYFEPSSSAFLHFSRHGDALCRLFDKLRHSDALRALDKMLTPGWIRAEGIFQSGAIDPDQKGKAVPPREPSRKSDEQATKRYEHFREQFYFTQQLIQLMESVYMDLDLERNHEHPNNRGWMNLFRQWAWCPMFRLAWKITAQNRGSRFVRFCEMQLRIPRFDGGLKVHWKVFKAGKKLHGDVVKEVKEELSSVERNFVERSALSTKDFQTWTNKVPWALGAAALRLSDFERSQNEGGKASAGKMPKWDTELLKKSTGIGLIVLVGDKDGKGKLTTIKLMRVQNHMRRIGLGARILDEVVTAYPSVRRVEIKATDYGLIGKLSEVEAFRQERLLQKMLDEAHQRAVSPAAPGA